MANSPVALQMDPRPESVSQTGQVRKATFRHLRGAFRKFVKRNLTSWIYPTVFFIDGCVISFARMFALRTPERRIVFVRTDNLGDLILWLPAARAIRASWPWPGCQFVLIANSAWSRFAEDLGVFDRIVPVNRVRLQRNPFYRIAAIFQLARIQAELLITAVHSRDATTTDSVARAIDARRKVASEGDMDNAYVDPSVPNSWYDELVPAISRPIHESLRNKKFTESLMGVEVVDPWPRLAPPSSKAIPGIVEGRSYAVLAPGASSPIKTWPAEKFSILAKRLKAEMSLDIILIGTESERAETAAVAQGCSGSVIDLTAQLKTEDLPAVIGQAKLVITNDTGTVHIAAALRVPTVCIVGGGHFGRFLPYPPEARDAGIRVLAFYHPLPCFNCNWKCVYPIRYSEPAPCVSNVSIDSVWIDIERLIIAPHAT